MFSNEILKHEQFKHCPKCGKLTRLDNVTTLSDGDSIEIILHNKCQMCKKMVESRINWNIFDLIRISI